MSLLPPGPRTSFTTLVRYMRDPIGCMIPMAREYGETFTLPGNPPTVFTGDPVHLKAIYSADPDTFTPMNTDMAVFIGSRSLLLLGGAEHRRARKVMSPPFQGARMRAYGAQMAALTRSNTARWRKGERVSALDTAQKISLDVIMQAVFGVTDPDRMQTLEHALLTITNGISPLLAMAPALRREFGGIGPYASFVRKRTALHAALDEQIESARAAGPRDDILSLLLAARYENGEPMSREELRDQLLLMVIAGHETTAISMAWAIYELHRPENADTLERLRAEIDAAGAERDADRFDKLPFLEAVCHETLRRYPIAPAPSPRRLLRPLQLGVYTLPVGTGVAPAIGLAHFREEVFPEPLRFRPDRFLGRKYTPFEFIPFGGGARRCLGASMALYEMKIVLGTLLQRFRLRLDSLKPVRGRVRAANAGPGTSIPVVIEETYGA